MFTTSIISLGGLGLASAIILGIASKLLSIKEDPRIEILLDVLPGVNCGGCGYSGCEGYAVALVGDASVPTTKCVVGPLGLPAELAKISGKAIGDVVKQISVRHCTKQEGNVQSLFSYSGNATCKSTAMFDKGFDACAYSCLGLGDCVTVCPFDAMEVVNGLVTIFSDLCTGCNQCVIECPRDVLTLAPITQRVEILCSTQAKPKDVMAVCGVGCISCSKCVKACPADAVAFDALGRIRIDHKKCLEYGPSCNEVCVDVCPRYILRSASVQFTAQIKEDQTTTKETEEA
ncbi:MAG: RnfABCDGE type electron transport complex subunit B [Desulfovibrionaceae bacterium]